VITQAGVSCNYNPDKKDVVLGILREALKDVASGNFSDDILTKTKEKLVKDYETGLKDNDYWTPTNTGAELPRATYVDGNWNRRVSSAWVKKADYFKLSNLQIGYTFDKKLIEPLKLTNARVYFAISNLALFSPYKKYGDPECGQGCVLYTGLDSGRYPNPRTFQFGVSFSF
jgi:outer membrane receptor protein involved in Fe transport